MKKTNLIRFYSPFKILINHVITINQLFLALKVLLKKEEIVIEKYVISSANLFDSVFSSEFILYLFFVRLFDSIFSDLTTT